MVGGSWLPLWTVETGIAGVCYKKAYGWILFSAITTVWLKGIMFAREITDIVDIKFEMEGPDTRVFFPELTEIYKELVLKYN